MWKLYFSLLLASIAIQHVSAQKNPADSLRSFVPTGVRFGTDIISLVKSKTSSRFKGWELNADVDFWRYNLSIDYGFWSRHIPLGEDAGAEYSNSGHYVRFGPDVNFLMKDPNRNMFFIGIRYAMSTFGEGLELKTGEVEESSVFTNDFGVVTHRKSNTLKARWGELVSGIKVKIWKGLWMGYTARMKFLHKIKGNPTFESYDTPGYGFHHKSIYWGFNYQVYWRFSWKNAGALRLKE